MSEILFLRMMGSPRRLREARDTLFAATYNGGERSVYEPHALA